MYSIKLLVSIVSIGGSCVLAFEAIRFLRGLRKDALTNREVRFFQVLVPLWLFLFAAHSSALFAVHSSTLTAVHSSDLFAPMPATSTLMWWVLANLLLAGLLQAQALRPVTARALLWCAIAVCGALLLTWPLGLGVAVIPLTLPLDFTIGMTMLAIIPLAVLTLLTSWKARRGQGDKSSAKRESVQQNANHL